MFLYVVISENLGYGHRTNLRSASKQGKLLVAKNRMFYRTRAFQRFGGISLGKSKIGFLNSKTDFEFFQ